MMNVGLIINPVSGLGGSVGLKGTDGAAIVEQALARGAKPRSGLRALAALEALAPVESQFTLLVPPGKMGEDAARQAGLSPTVLGGVCQNARGALAATSAGDTAAVTGSSVPQAPRGDAAGALAPRSERAESRALTSASGIDRCFAVAIRLGHSSVSMSKPSCGLK